MKEIPLSEIENNVLVFIKENTEVKFKDIKEKFGDKGIGTVGKLKCLDLVEIIKNYQNGSKTIKLKKEINNESL